MTTTDSQSLLIPKNGAVQDQAPSNESESFYAQRENRHATEGAVLPVESVMCMKLAINCRWREEKGRR